MGIRLSGMNQIIELSGRLSRAKVGVKHRAAFFAPVVCTKDQTGFCATIVGFHIADSHPHKSKWLKPFRKTEATGGDFIFDCVDREE
jgi:hypothetical protein